MNIFRVMGFALFLLVLSALVPNVFVELQRTTVTFLESSQQAFLAAGVIASYAARIPSSLH